MSSPTSPVVVGLLHPGAMGESIGAALTKAGHTCLWVTEGRSAASHGRAEAHSMLPVATVPELVAHDPLVIISVCPPAFAVDIATGVRQAGYCGLYVDANAISPETAMHIQHVVEARASPAGASGQQSRTLSRSTSTRIDTATYVDGCIIGPPAWQEGSTRLYLSGDRAGEVAALFAGTLLDARLLRGGVGAASALQMAHAGWAKASGALLAATNAFALASGVHEDLQAEWAISQPHLIQQDRAMLACKAWRSAGDMEEISAAFAARGLPPGFHDASAEVFGRLWGYKDSTVAEISDLEVARTVAYHSTSQIGGSSLGVEDEV